MLTVNMLTSFSANSISSAGHMILCLQVEFLFIFFKFKQASVEDDVGSLQYNMSATNTETK